MRIALLSLLLVLPVAAQTRLASDFEIAQMEKQLAQQRDFEAQLSGRLNLGDVRAARNELSLARNEYRTALAVAERERVDARRDSSLSRYANATSYAALAQAKLGREPEAFALLEECARYASDDAETWNLYASAMRVLRRPQKAVSAARNAVAIALKSNEESDDLLDVAIYQHALATALIEANELVEAETLLVQVTASLRSREFESLQRQVAREESFEVYSSARGDVAAYVSLLNRAQLRLASLYERRGDAEKARTEYERVLAGRSDDVTALSALARLAKTETDRDRRYAEAFEANPFSMPLVREYQRYARERALSVDASTTGGAMRKAIVQLARGDLLAARASLDALLAKFPQNDTLRTLREEAEGTSEVPLPSPNPTGAELRVLLSNFERLGREQRVTLDQTTYTSDVQFDAAATPQRFEAGSIEGVPFRFTTATQFAGTFDATQPLRLTYRILGVTRSGDTFVLLFEPVRLEEVR